MCKVKSFLRSLHSPWQVLDLRTGELTTVSAVGYQDALLQVCAMVDGVKVSNETEFTYHVNTVGFGYFVTNKDHSDMTTLAANWAEWIREVA